MFGAIRLISFEENSQVITVDFEHYCTMLQTGLAKKLQKRGKGCKCVASTRCCSGPHSKVKHEFCREMFPGHVISPLDDIL
jgi:hypothetical protein